MPITTSTLLLLTIAGVSTLILLVYFYSNELSIPQTIQLPNGTKITTSPEKITQATNLGFIHAFIASISVIVVSEIGDKTFFIAAILAMRHSRLIIYSGAMAALGAMTILSALLGNVVTKFVPRIYTFYLSSLLFACFGLKMLRDGYKMSADEGTDEYEEVQQEVEKAEAGDDLELGGGGVMNNNSGKDNIQQQLKKATSDILTIIRRYVSPIFIQALVMTFLAEWGDRSQITTIVLAASENLLGVIIGGTIGHGLCTGLAVIGGRFIAQRISPKTVTLVGGVVFLLFAVSACFIRPEK